MNSTRFVQYSKICELNEICEVTMERNACLLTERPAASHYFLNDAPPQRDSCSIGIFVNSTRFVNDSNICELNEMREVFEYL